MRRFLDEFGFAPVAIPHNPKNPKTQDVLLTKGMSVIAHTTSKKYPQLANIQDYQPQCELDHRERRRCTHQNMHRRLPQVFYLGFYITIHALQGETALLPYTIHDWRHPWFCERARYVALSRGTSIHNIQIKQ